MNLPKICPICFHYTGISSSYNYPNPTNLYRNNSSSYRNGRPKYTYSSNPFDDHFNNDSVWEEQMRFYREQQRYSSYYRPGQEHSSQTSNPVPMKTLITVGIIVCAIFFFDALFVTMTYNNDITNLQRHYAPINNRRLNRIKKEKTNEDDGTKEMINQGYEAEIDDKIRQYKEYESKTNVPLYKTETSK
jgi:hypothetical protein